MKQENILKFRFEGSKKVTELIDTIYPDEAIAFYYDMCKAQGKPIDSGGSIPIRYKDCDCVIDRKQSKLVLQKYYGTDSNFVIPDVISMIGDNAFAGNQYLKQIVFHKDIVSIGNASFANCKNLENVIFPSGLKRIGQSAFAGCSKFTTIVLPESLEALGQNAFANCSSLEDVTILNDDFSFNSTPFKNTNVSLFEFDSFKYFSPTRFEGLIEESNNSQEKKPAPVLLGIPFKKFPDCSNLTEFAELLHNYGHVFYGIYIGMYIDFSILKSKHLFDIYSEEELPQLISLCRTNLSEMLPAISIEQIMNNVLGKIDLKKYIHNMKLFLDAGIVYTPIPGFAYFEQEILKNGVNLVSTNIENAFNNYQWLINQKIITEEVLDKFFFNGEKIRNIQGLKYYYDKYKELPELFNSLLVNSNDKNLLELKDKLVYISVLELLDGDLDKREKAKQIMQRDLFQSITEYDQYKMQRINPYFRFDNKPKEFDGIYAVLYRKMGGIDPEWFSEFFEMSYNNREELTSFFLLLNSIKAWNNFSSEKERAEFLKNEIVGRLLYTDLLIFANENKLTKDKDIVKAYRAARASSYKFPSVRQLVSSISRGKISLFSNPSIVKAMLTIDPYSFDALREINFDKVTNQSLEMKYVKDADNNGYYLSDDIRKKYQKLVKGLEFQNRKDRTFIEYLSNRVDIPIDNSKIVDKLEESIKNFVQNSDLDELYNICNIFDFHLRHSKEYDICTLQGNDFAKDSKIVFDRNSQEFSTEAEMPRVLYCLFNLNKLSKHSYDLKVKKWDDMRLNDPNQKEQYFSKIDRYRKNISVLEENDIPISVVRNLYEASKKLKPQVVPDVNKIMKFLSIDVYTPQETIDEISQSLSETINLYEQYPEDIDDLEIAAKEQQDVYECKNLFSKYAMQRFGILTQDNLVSAISLSKEQKIKRFQELGYAVEVQKDDKGALVLACYCKGITDSFSVHLKDILPRQMNQLAQLCNPTDYLIATTKIPNRLRITGSKEGQIDINNCDKTRVGVGFNSPNGLSDKQIEQQRDDVAYKNADTFGIVNDINKNAAIVPNTMSNNTSSELEDMLSNNGQQSIDRFTFADADSSYTLEEAQGHRR